jgi:hypothetical protein
MQWQGLFFVAAGVFAILGAVLEWGFFMNHHKARFLVNMFGRNGTRAFYVALGLMLVVGGALFSFGLIKSST